ncbi:Pyruvate decarboxylase 3 [Ancistrocladus abbreviatus]
MATLAACPSKATLGRHLAQRLVQIGVNDVFSVPGDFNLNLVGCCNERNAGYARSRGIGACVVTFTVGGLSVLNAIAGVYSENLPVICIVGGPNSNGYGTNRVLRHTIGLPDFSQELCCFQTVTCFQAVVNNLVDAHELIDTAISTALKERALNAQVKETSCDNPELERLHSLSWNSSMPDDDPLSLLAGSNTIDGGTFRFQSPAYLTEISSINSIIRKPERYSMEE